MYLFKRNPDPRQKPPVGSILNTDHPLSKGLVGCWLMNEGGGNKAYDLSGYGNNGDIVNANHIITLYGESINLDDSSEYIEVGINGITGDGGHGSYIIGTILNYSTDNTVDNQHWFGVFGPASYADGGWDFKNNQEYQDIRINHEDASGTVVGTDLISATVLSANTFYQLGYVWNSAKGHRRYFRNGIVDAEDLATSWTPSLTNVSALRIGNDSAIPNNYDGKIIYAFLFNRDLSDSEILQLYEEPYGHILAPQYWYMVDFGAAAATYTKTANIDALIKKVNTETSTYLDSILLKNFPINLSIDSILLLAKTSTLSIDTFLKATNTVSSLNIDVLLKDLGITKTANMDALLLKAYQKNLSIDAFLKQLSTETSTNLDGILLKNYIKSISIDAILKALDITTNISIDSILKSSNIIVNTNLDAILQAAGGVTITTSIDALLKKYGITYSCNLDAILQSQGILTYTSLDSILALSQEKITIIDAILKSYVSNNIFIDSILKKELIAQSIDIDTILQTQNSLITNIDSILKKSILSSIIVDAYLKKSNTGSTYLDSLLSKISNIQFNVDALLVSSGGTGIINIDALLKKTKSLVGIIDAILISSSHYVRYSFLSSGRDTSFLSSGRDTSF